MDEHYKLRNEAEVASCLTAWHWESWAGRHAPGLLDRVRDDARLQRGGLQRNHTAVPAQGLPKQICSVLRGKAPPNPNLHFPLLPWTAALACSRRSRTGPTDTACCLYCLTLCIPSTTPNTTPNNKVLQSVPPPNTPGGFGGPLWGPPAPPPAPGPACTLPASECPTLPAVYIPYQSKLRY